MSGASPRSFFVQTPSALVLLKDNHHANLSAASMGVNLL
jgi:hypothetical protein